MVRQVGERIVKALPQIGEEVSGYWKHLEQYQWEFVAVDSGEANAFVVPGGKVVVYTGVRSPQHSQECTWHVDIDRTSTPY
jgi:metalloendopeptidase OMA1, mitochondrial